MEHWDRQLLREPRGGGRRKAKKKILCCSALPLVWLQRYALQPLHGPSHFRYARSRTIGQSLFLVHHTFESECCTTSCATPELHMRCRSSGELPGLCHLACLYLPGSLAVSTLFARLVFTRVCVCRICKCRKEKSNLPPEPALIYIDILPVPSASMFAPGRPPFLSHVASSRPFSWIFVASLTYLVSGNRFSVIFGA